jgi:2-polyprenyl-3-methyl-5-hydroxy-6-metoxy-1,4-benzoquinol methylase
VVYDGSGVKRFAEECWRVIKPGGSLVVTTPNACSLFSIIELLERRAPMLWRQNVREYTLSEITQIFEEVGFQLAYSTTWFVYHFLDPADIEPLARRYLDTVGASREGRGDSMCFVFTKCV